MVVVFLVLFLLISFILYSIGSVIYNTIKVFRLSFHQLFRHDINRYFIIRNLRPEYRKILQDCFLYYHQLDAKNKKLFEKRVQKFIDQKRFLPSGGLKEVLPEMKTLIAASAVQLTFGLPGVYFAHFKTIHVYPDTYFSEGMQQYNAGEVHKVGLIMLSWRDFIEGYLNAEDARNLGLHEMAHALRLENMIMNEEYGYLEWDDIQLFNDYTVEETNKINAGIESLFRPYAAVHYQEFFAVLIEVFFEQPKQLKEYHPNLYQVTCKLLKQNPLEPNLRIR